MIVAAEDGTCAPKYAEAIRTEIGDAVVYYEELPGVGHGYFDDAWTDKWLKLVGDALEYDLTDRRNLAHEDILQ